MVTKDVAQRWHPLGQEPLSERIRLEILRVLEGRNLSPGDRLPSERDLAARLRVSRPSVREAVRSLQAEGRLIVKHGQGVFVAEPGVRKALRESMARLDHNLSELFDMREVLEVPAARWAAQRHNEAALQKVVDAFNELEHELKGEHRDFDRLQRLDATFHLRIVQAAGNRLLEESQGVLNELLATGLKTTLTIDGRLEKSRTEHARILEALVAGDPRVAAQAAKSHVVNVRRAANKRIATVSASLESGPASEPDLPLKRRPSPSGKGA